MVTSILWNYVFAHLLSYLYSFVRLAEFYSHVYNLILFICSQAKDCLSLNLDENGLNQDVFGKALIEISQRDSGQIPDQVAWHRIIDWRIFSVAWC